MKRACLILAAVLVAVGQGGVAHGMGGNLKRPSIAVPVDPGTQKPDPVVRKLADVLQSHKQTFTGGWFLNAHSVLYFGGGANGVKQLVDGLRTVKGATVRVDFSDEPGRTRWMFPDEEAEKIGEKPCDCQVDHLAWGDSRSIHVTVYRNGGRIKPESLDPKTPPKPSPRAQEKPRGRP